MNLTNKNKNDITLKNSFKKNCITLNILTYNIYHNMALSTISIKKIKTIDQNPNSINRINGTVIRKLLFTIQGIAKPTEPFKRRAATAAMANPRHRK